MRMQDWDCSCPLSTEPGGRACPDWWRHSSSQAWCEHPEALLLTCACQGRRGGSWGCGWGAPAAERVGTGWPPEGGWPAAQLEARVRILFALQKGLNTAASAAACCYCCAAAGRAQRRHAPPGATAPPRRTSPLSRKVGTAVGRFLMGNWAMDWANGMSSCQKAGGGGGGGEVRVWGGRAHSSRAAPAALRPDHLALGFDSS